MRRIRSDCWARAPSDQSSAAAATAPPSFVMNSRRRMQPSHEAQDYTQNRACVWVGRSRELTRSPRWPPLAETATRRGRASGGQDRVQNIELAGLHQMVWELFYNQSA